MDAAPGLKMTSEPARIEPVRRRAEAASLLLRRWRSLALAGALGGAAGATADAVIPSSYRAQAKLAVLPINDPVTPVGMSAIDGASATLPVLAALLQSRRVGGDVVAKLGLVALYRAPSADAATSELWRHVSVVPERRSNTNLVTVAADDLKPEAAREIVATLVDVAIARNVDLWAGRIREERVKLQARLDEVGRELASSEEALRRFREERHVVDLQAQIKATVDQVAALQSRRIDKLVGLHFARGFAAQESDEVRRAERERSGVEEQLLPLVRGRSLAPPLLPLDELPGLEEEQGRRMRAVSVCAARYELLARQIEILRAAEAGPAGRVEIIDEPTKPQARSRPGRPTIALASAMGASLLLAAFVVARRV